MTKTQSNLPRRWQEIAKAQQRDALTLALAELRQIDEDIDYSYQESMELLVYNRGRGYDSGIFSQEAESRRKFRERKYEILARLFGKAV